jgi:hypothetical protein
MTDNVYDNHTEISQEELEEMEYERLQRHAFQQK